MGKNILAIEFILCVFGLLVWNRVDLGPQETVRVYRNQSLVSNPSYSIGHIFRRGETISTGKNEFVEVLVGELIVIDLDENTNLELKSLSRNNVRVGFGHGRILVTATDGGVITVDTPTAQNTLKTSGKLSASREDLAKASFIGYDFNRLTSIIPIVNTIYTSIPLLNQTFEVTNPITIHDVNPPSVENMTFDEKTDARKEFYEWAAQN